MSENGNGTTALDPGDYWRLRASGLELERDQAALTIAQARFEATRARHDALWRALTVQYALDPLRPYAASDDLCSLKEQAHAAVQ